MTERERRAGPGGTEDNVRDELDEAAGQARQGRFEGGCRRRTEHKRCEGQRQGRVGRITGALRAL